MNDETVSISAERLKQLEELEASIPTMIEKAILEYKKSNLKKLHERDKANPAAINQRVKRYVERHREEINRKRREKRLQMKNEKLKLDKEPENLLIDITDNYTPVKVESIFVRAASDAISKSDKPIVRKQNKRNLSECVIDKESNNSQCVSLHTDRLQDVTVRFDT
jgi:hypothetical protein